MFPYKEIGHVKELLHSACTKHLAREIQAGQVKSEVRAKRSKKWGGKRRDLLSLIFSFDLFAFTTFFMQPRCNKKKKFCSAIQERLLNRLDKLRWL